jgi:hypothetical protein
MQMALSPNPVDGVSSQEPMSISKVVIMPFTLIALLKLGEQGIESRQSKDIALSTSQAG